MSSVSTHSASKSSIIPNNEPTTTELVSFKMRNLQINTIKTRNSIQNTKIIPKKISLISHQQVKNPPESVNLPPKQILDPIPESENSSVIESPFCRSLKKSSLRRDSFSIESSLKQRLSNSPFVKSKFGSNKKFSKEKDVRREVSTFFYTKTHKMAGMTPCFRRLKILENIKFDTPEFKKSFIEFKEILDGKKDNDVNIDDLEKECFPSGRKPNFSDYLRLRLVENRILMNDFESEESEEYNVHD